MKPSFKTIMAAFLALFIASAAAAQTFTAALRGTVTDPSGAAIPGAKVVITEVERNIDRETTTDAEGRYAFFALPPGRYSLSVEAGGFRKYVQSDFTLAVQQQATINVQLQVGDVTTTVEVTGQAPLLNTTMASLGQVIDNKYILSLPNLGRDSLALVYLTPGVVGSAGRRGDTNTNFVAGGARNSTSDVLVDGLTVTTVEQNSGITDLKYKPSVDAVQEFKMQTNFFPAEYGQTGGAVINVVTKSGTNELHGVAFEYHNNNRLNTAPYFRSATFKMPKTTQNIFGGTLGGPVIKDKLFYFFSFEGTYEGTGYSGNYSVAPQDFRNGDFSKWAGYSIVYDPATAPPNQAANRQPFPGNVVPKSRWNPIFPDIYAKMPGPNQVSPTDPNNLQGNYFALGVLSLRRRQYDFKSNWAATSKLMVWGKYSRMDAPVSGVY
ncbi:MAG: TonB-dependent receptor, partial [Bryobacteraceae bacterium]|nr:TonB-dependent receptor [Bryobacteraceae bacterium]